MEDAQGAAAIRYWCHMCSQMVDPVIEVEIIKCPLCESGFVEQMDSISTSRVRSQIPDGDLFGDGEGGGLGIESDSDRALSLWAPILLGMMSNPRRRSRRFRRRSDFEYDDENDDSNGDHHNNGQHEEGETELDRELQSFIRRRRRSSATILQLLQGIRAGMLYESNNNSESENGDADRDTTEIRDRNRVILINPLNQTIILQGGNSRNPNRNPVGSLGDYFMGPGLDLLLQHLAENDPNRYGTPPAKKEAVEAMPTVKIKEDIQCSVCLDDLETGTEAKEMPCKHKFHSGCILPWLELHSSCPVCRYQLPSSERKLNSDEPTNNNNDNYNNNSSNNNNRRNSGVSSNGSGSISEERNANENGRSENRRGFLVPLPWPLSTLFSSSGNRSSSSSSSSSTNATRNASHADEN